MTLEHDVCRGGATDGAEGDGSRDAEGVAIDVPVAAGKVEASHAARLR